MNTQSDSFDGSDFRFVPLRSDSRKHGVVIRPLAEIRDAQKVRLEQRYWEPASRVETNYGL